MTKFITLTRLNHGAQHEQLKIGIPYEVVHSYYRIIMGNEIVMLVLKVNGRTLTHTPIPEGFTKLLTAKEVKLAKVLYG